MTQGVAGEDENAQRTIGETYDYLRGISVAGQRHIPRKTEIKRNLAELRQRSSPTKEEEVEE